LIPALDEYIIPTVLCPWGCSEYLSKTGTIGVDVLMQKQFPSVNLPMMGNSSKRHYLLGKFSRSDYFRNCITDYDCLVMKSEWKVLPGMIFKTGKGPCFLTCNNHSDGSQEMYLHVPRTPFWPCAPAERGDQLAHTVIQPRLVRSMKRNLYNTSYKTMEVRVNMEV
jgi:hypothetical protein